MDEIAHDQLETPNTISDQRPLDELLNERSSLLGEINALASEVAHGAAQHQGSPDEGRLAFAAAYSRAHQLLHPSLAEGSDETDANDSLSELQQMVGGDLVHAAQIIERGATLRRRLREIESNALAPAQERLRRERHWLLEHTDWSKVIDDASYDLHDADLGYQAALHSAISIAAYDHTQAEQLDTVVQDLVQLQAYRPLLEERGISGDEIKSRYGAEATQVDIHAIAHDWLDATETMVMITAGSEHGSNLRDRLSGLRANAQFEKLQTIIDGHLPHENGRASAALVNVLFQKFWAVANDFDKADQAYVTEAMANMPEKAPLQNEHLLQEVLGISDPAAWVADLLHSMPDWYWRGVTGIVFTDGKIETDSAHDEQSERDGWRTNGLYTVGSRVITVRVNKDDWPRLHPDASGDGLTDLEMQLRADAALEIAGVIIHEGGHHAAFNTLSTAQLRYFVMALLRGGADISPYIARTREQEGDIVAAIEDVSVSMEQYLLQPGRLYLTSRDRFSNLDSLFRRYGPGRDIERADLEAELQRRGYPVNDNNMHALATMWFHGELVLPRD